METLVKKPNLYDLLYRDVTEDIAMYFKLLKGHQNILEFGAGSGRVTIPLAEAGHYMDAVDIEEAMLESLSEKIRNNITLSQKINPILGNMCGYKTNRKYEVIIIPLTSFNYLLTEEEQISCLQSLYDNLDDKGFAIVELLSNNTFSDLNTNNEFSFVKRIDVSNNQYYEYYRNTKLNMADREITQKRLFKLFENGKLVSEENFIWNNRFVTIADFRRLASMTNLNIEEIYGNCNLEKYDENSEDVFVKIRRV